MVTLRTLEPADQGDYRTLWTNALTEHSSHFRIVADDDPGPVIPTCFVQDSFTLGAYQESRLVGSVSLDRDRGVKLRHKALLFRMFVHSSVAGQGVGKALLREVISRAEVLDDLRQIRLTVLATNERARRLYGSVGFQDYALEPGAVRITDRYVDEVQMVRFLRDIRVDSMGIPPRNGT